MLVSYSYVVYIQRNVFLEDVREKKKMALCWVLGNGNDSMYKS